MLSEIWEMCHQYLRCVCLAFHPMGETTLDGTPFRNIPWPVTWLDPTSSSENVDAVAWDVLFCPNNHTASPDAAPHEPVMRRSSRYLWLVLLTKLAWVGRQRPSQLIFSGSGAHFASFSPARIYFMLCILSFDHVGWPYFTEKCSLEVWIGKPLMVSDPCFQSNIVD